MKLVTIAMALGVCLASSAALAGPSICNADLANPVANCGFETGDFTGWNLSGAYALSQGNLFGVDTQDANSGTYGAYFGNTAATPGVYAAANNLVLSEAVTLEQGRQYKLSFELAQSTPAYTGYTNFFAASFDGVVLMAETAAAATSGFVDYSFTVTGRGSDSVAFVFQNDDGDWSFDDVDLSQIPEPSSVALLAVGLLGFGLRKKARLGGACRPPQTPRL
jgi:hypothetical protein